MTVTEFYNKYAGWNGFQDTDGSSLGEFVVRLRRQRKDGAKGWFLYEIIASQEMRYMGMQYVMPYGDDREFQTIPALPNVEFQTPKGTGRLLAALSARDF